MELRMPAIFSDHMVLQRGKHVLIFGSAPKGSVVKVNIAGQTACAVSDSKWEVVLNPMEAGGPYDLSVVCGDEQIVYSDVYFGEVWLAGGQSNMELELQNSDDGQEVIRHTDDELLRFYYTPKVSHLCDELYEAEDNSCWQICRPYDTACWSAVAYYFAAKMREVLDVPVGIIGCNWGGTYAHNWVSVDSLRKRRDTAAFIDEYEDMVSRQDFDGYLRELKEYREYYAEWVKRVDECYRKEPGIAWSDVLSIAGENRWPGPSGPYFEYRPCGLYESMLIRVAPYTLGGVIYYQGESDENNNAVYYELMTNLIEEWRRVFKDASLPFAMVELPVHAPDTEKTGFGWGGIRRAQQRICNDLKNTSLTVILECGNKMNIHPTDKRTVGLRLAENVLKDFFGRVEFDGNGPRLKEFKYEEVGIRLFVSCNFIYTTNIFHEGAVKCDELVRASGKSVAPGFEIAGDDGIYYPAEADIRGNEIFVSSGKVVSPRNARYGHANYFECRLYDDAGRPIMPFWTDLIR